MGAGRTRGLATTAFAAAACVTVVALSLTTAESHDAGDPGPSDVVIVTTPDPVAPSGPVTEADYLSVIEARVACANHVLGDELIGLAPDRSGRTLNVTYDVSDREYSELEEALNECTTPEGLGIEAAWLAETSLTPDDFPEALAEVEACTHRRGVAMPSDIADRILSTSGEVRAEAIFDLLEALSGTPAAACWEEAGFGSFSS